MMPQTILQRTKILATVNSLNEALTLSVISDASVDVRLLRIELLFLNCPELPSEGKQYRIYLHMSDLFPDRMLTFRSFDFGGDKFDGMPESWKLQGTMQEHEVVSGTLVADEDFRHQICAILRLYRHRRVRILFLYITNSA